MLAIYKKELRSYFTTMIGYIYIALFLVIVGIYFIAYNMKSQLASFEYVLSAIQFLFIILVPILTMRLIAEENKQKTDQLLLTAPVSIFKIVVAKYLAALTMFLIPIVVICFYPLIIRLYGSVDFLSTYVAIVGFVLLGAAFMALGMFISAITENQVIALIVTAILIFCSYLMPGIVELIPNDTMSAWLCISLLIILLGVISYLVMRNSSFSIGVTLVVELGAMILYLIKPSVYEGMIQSVFNVFSLNDRFTNFTTGILDGNATIYYISIIGMFLLLTIQMMKKRRWS